jgi:hypothetical protein
MCRLLSRLQGNAVNPLARCLRLSRYLGLAAVLLFLGNGDAFGQDLPTVQFTTNAVTVNQSDGYVFLTAVLSAPTQTGAYVQAATQPGTAISPDQYITWANTLNFCPLEPGNPAIPDNTKQTFYITLGTGTPAGTTTSFTVVLSNPVGATLGTNSTVTITITNVPPPPPPTVQFSKAKYFVKESAGSKTITVKLSSVPTSPVTVNYATSDGTGRHAALEGTNYTTTSGTLTFNPPSSSNPGDPASTSQTFTVPVLKSGFEGPDRWLNLTLSPPNGATMGTPSAAKLEITAAQDAAPGMVVLVTKKDKLIDELSSGTYGYKFETQVKIPATAKPPAGKTIQRFKSSTFGINPEQKTDSAKKYVFDNVAITWGGLLQALKDLPLDTNARYITSPDQQVWILRYAKVEGEGGFFLGKPPVGMPDNGAKSEKLADYNSWAKYFNAPAKYARWTIAYEYLYIDAAPAKKAKLDQDAILALITDDGVKKRVKTILKDAKKTLGSESAAILYSDSAFFVWPAGTPVGIVAADFKKKK